MTENKSLERFVADQLADDGTGSAQAERISALIYEQTDQVRQRPRWLAVIKEPPMRISSSLAVGSPTARVAAIIAATLLLALALAAAGVAGSRLLAAGPIVVDPDGDGSFTTITEAVANAQDGDTILVRPGTYLEAFIVDKNITLSGDGPLEDIVIMAPDDGPTSPASADDDEPNPYAMLLQGSDATVSGLTFRGAASEVHVDGGAPLLQGLALEGVGAIRVPRQPSDKGLVLKGGTTATIRNNVLNDGGDIQITDRSEPLIEDNVLTGPGIFGRPGEATIIRRNMISKTPWTAILFFEATTALVEGNIITDSGSGIEFWEGTPLIRDNSISGTYIAIYTNDAETIDGNVLTDNEFGIYSEQGSASLVGNRVTGNDVGLQLVSMSEPTLTDNFICENQINMRLISLSKPETEGNEICPETPSEE